ncbi:MULTISPECIES: LuxR C-terminal-related transcriptional regulator [Streptomyces]|uniref:LuxR C-terminal-related transcriptional regulator n=1 Tax=Streptomyces TaxID=1883 RepID=UPI0019625740|nr:MULTISPECIES: LuxR C-terminal-related transcriptional regulator [Streptomyces]QRX95023.1 response regulator transcription factor [Streptomyces noursei]
MAALTEAVADMYKALGEAQDALEAQEQLIENLRAAAGSSPSEGVLAARAALDLLTARERQILVLISQGNSNRRVARALGISEKTVKNHLSAVFTKAGVSDRTQAVVLGIRGGIVSLDGAFNDASPPMRPTSSTAGIPTDSGPC